MFYPHLIELQFSQDNFNYVNLVYNIIDKNCAVESKLVYPKTKRYFGQKQFNEKLFQWYNCFKRIKIQILFQNFQNVSKLFQMFHNKNSSICHKIITIFRKFCSMCFRNNFCQKLITSHLIYFGKNVLYVLYASERVCYNETSLYLCEDFLCKIIFQTMFVNCD